MGQWGLSAESLGFTAEDFGPKLWRSVLAELIATLLFVFVGAGTVVVVVGVIGANPGMGGDPDALAAIALAHGLTIALLVAGTAKISGGHINPAVTFGAVITGRMKLSTGVLYVGAQLAGAVIGALLVEAAVVAQFEGNLGAHALNLEVLDGKGAGVLVEAVLTFILVFTVFATAMDPRGMANLAPIAIGLAVLVDHFVGVPLTGASMNPARSFGPALVADAWDDHWVYWLGPLIGGGLAALVYYFTFMWGSDEE
ncbi:MAG: MIP family channel protein [Dehalococcoidia bacterium]